MLKSWLNLAMSTSVLKALPGKFDFKRHSPSISISMSQALFTAMVLSFVSVFDCHAALIIRLPVSK